MMIDITNKLTTEKPQIKLGDLVCTVNNTKNCVLQIMQILEGEGTDIAKVDKILLLALGEETQAKIDAMDLPFPAYQTLMIAVMAAATNTPFGKAEARFRNGGK